MAAAALAAAGAHLVLGARRLEAAQGLAQALAARGHAVRALAVDVGDARDMQRFISLAHAWFGRLDVIVNSAGLRPAAVPCLDDPALRGALHGIRAGLPLLRARGQGQIVNLVPRGAGAARQALRALSEGLQHELGAGLRITRVELAACAGDAAAGRAIVRAITREAVAGGRRHVDAEHRLAATPIVACGADHRFAETMIPASGGDHRFDETSIVTCSADHRFDETSLVTCAADHRFPSSPSGLRAFFGENGGRPRSSGANLN
jgi:NAD(P)-dependent dehydrogenase (short-subunit alcohol dehydrogenase family)